MRSRGQESRIETFTPIGRTFNIYESDSINYTRQTHISCKIYCLFTIFCYLEPTYFLLSVRSMIKSRSPIDGNLIVRYLHLHTLKYIYQLATSNHSESPESIAFPEPGFQLFRPIPRFYKGEKDRYKFFKNILLGFRWEMSIGILFTVIYASLNLLLSQIVKEFIQTMQLSESKRSSSEITEKFVVLQILRMVFGAHMKRLFQQMALQIESTIAKSLVKKALLLDPDYRKRLPQTEIYQLQNVDMKLIHNLFSVLYLGCEIPYTIGVAIIWLFGLNISLGVIALYWFLVVFLVQRTLDDRMKLGNLAKLGLIDQRSKLNYEFMQKIRQARVVHAESLMVQRNNDFFLQECHDHMIFYRYASLYDIVQLMLPILVVVTSMLYDQNSEQAITIEELYLILSLLGICYRPMKEFRTLSIALSDGLHSLRRITDYLQLPEKKLDLQHYSRIEEGKAELVIKKNTIGKVSGRGMGIELEVSYHIEAKAGDRVVVLGRRGQGSSTFLNMIAGLVRITEGQISLNGKIAFLSQQNFILCDTLYKNLAFYDSDISPEEVDKVCKELQLYQQLFASNGLQYEIEPSRYSQNQLKMLSLARVLCSKAPIYILDSPFTGLTKASLVKVQRILRQRQKEGVLIVIALKRAEYLQPDDLIVILNVAMTKEVGRFKDLSHSPNSNIDNFIREYKNDNLMDEQEKAFRRVAHQFQNKVRKSMIYSALFQRQSDVRQRSSKMSFLVDTLKNYSKKLLTIHNQKQKRAEEEQQEAAVAQYFFKFLKTCKLSESAYILIIIVAVEVLHIFIHFYIGHEYEHRAQFGLEALKTLMIYEVVLTIGLGGLIYLEGEVSSHLAVIAGNKLYKESLESLVHREIRWYSEEYSLRTADKFNHDYEQIFILVHGVLTLYKNLVILLITALFVGGSHYIVLIMTAGVAGLYYCIWQLVREAHTSILKRYYDYKYQFVKVFHQSLEGAQLINVCGVNREVIEKGKTKYTNFASYKLAAHYVKHGQTLLCDIAATIITALALEFGTEADIDRNSVSGLATSILLLLNLADVLKAILDAAIEVQIFFRINIMPFMDIVPMNSIPPKGNFPNPPSQYDLKLDTVLFKEKDENIFQIYPLKLNIPHGQSICIYEEDQILRNNLLYGLTRNLTTVANRSQKSRNVFVGGVPLCDISSINLRTIFGVILNENFFISGTLEDNLKWRCPKFDPREALLLSKAVGIGQDLKRFKELGLKANIQEPDDEFSEGLSKKIALVRLILHRSQIVIIMDTPPFVGRWSIKEILKKYNPGCTIIKITNSLEVAFDVERIVLMEHLHIVEEGNPKRLVGDQLSKIGEMLRLCNEETYIYRNRVSVNPRTFKKEYQKIAMLTKSKKGK